MYNSIMNAQMYFYQYLLLAFHVSEKLHPTCEYFTKSAQVGNFEFVQY